MDGSILAGNNVFGEVLQAAAASRKPRRAGAGFSDLGLRPRGPGEQKDELCAPGAGASPGTPPPPRLPARLPCAGRPQRGRPLARGWALSVADARGAAGPGAARPRAVRVDGGAAPAPPIPGLRSRLPPRTLGTEGARGGMAPGGAPRPVLPLLALLLLVAPARAVLKPTFFNVATVAQIWANATCGEPVNGRPQKELFCSLSGGSSDLVIQVGSARRPGGRACDPATGTGEPGRGAGPAAGRTRPRPGQRVGVGPARARPSRPRLRPGTSW